MPRVERRPRKQGEALEPGDTLAAAVNLGRRAVGIEKEARYCAAIVERLAQRTLFGGEG